MTTGSTSPQEPTVWQRLFQHLQTLDFISSFFTWLFLLGNRLAEPLMSLSAIYVIISAGILKWHIPTVYDFAIAIMIAAPEIILLGAFILAGRERQRGNGNAWMM